MSHDFVVKANSLERSKIDKTTAYGATTAVFGIPTAIAGKAASIFCPKGSMAKSIFSGASSLSIFAGIIGLAALGGAYFIKDSITSADIIKQQGNVYIADGKDRFGNAIDALKGKRGNIRESEIKYYIELIKLNWLKTKKGIQQTIYSILGWRK